MLGPAIAGTPDQHAAGKPANLRDLLFPCGTIEAELPRLRKSSRESTVKQRFLFLVMAIIVCASVFDYGKSAGHYGLVVVGGLFVLFLLVDKVIS